MMYTHFLNAIVTMASTAALIAVPLYAWARADWVEPGLPLAAICGALWIFAFLFVTMRFSWPLANWLYLRLLRGTPVTFRQARDFTQLLSPGGNGTWYPLKELTQIPREQRIQYLYDFLAHLRAEGMVRTPPRWGRWFMGI